MQDVFKYILHLKSSVNIGGFVRVREKVAVVRSGREEAVADSWTREEMNRHQDRQLHALLQLAKERCPFHRRRLPRERVSSAAGLKELPVMYKQDLAESFDDITTDRRLTTSAIARHLQGVSGSDPLLLGEYRVLASGGTSGIATYVPFDRSSWQRVLATYVRLALSHGFGPRFLPRRRMAQITAGGALHMTNRMATSNRSPAYVTLRLDLTAPIAELARALEGFRPDFLSGYPSVVAALAEEHRAGRLDISPQWVFCGSEQFLPSARASIRDAWGIEPFDLYATTETGGVLAFECPAHEGLHIREDFCLAEAVDNDELPVSDGEPASGLLVTSWLNRTLPLIRYRLDDEMTLTSDPCRCGRHSKRIVALSGRAEDTIRLADAHGREILVHPNNFEETIEERPEIARYQVLQRPESITVSAVAREPQDTGWTAELASEIRTRLRTLGAEPPPIHVDIVSELERPATNGAKLKIIRSEMGAQIPDGGGLSRTSA
jgi:phenylacetate-CoA ligase